MNATPSRFERFRFWLDQRGLYAIAQDLAKVVVNRFHRKDPRARRIITLAPPGISRGNALLSHIIDPFMLKPGQPIPHSHTNFAESYTIANTLLQLGFSVDVISVRNGCFLPRKHYSLFIDTRFNFELARYLNDDCIKILHGETAHYLFHNAAQAKRLLNLYQRRGAMLQPRKWEMSASRAFEIADYVTIYGNEFNLETYRRICKPVYLLPISATDQYPWDEGKEFEACRRNFLWFGSGALVHKGLDLVLEAFAQMPECRLTVCGPVDQEKDFQAEFYRELYETPNIETVGWVDTRSARFRQIIQQCVGLVYVSCSEGGGGSVVQCMHAGLIPITSYETGVHVGDFGVTLRKSSIETVKDAVRNVSELPAAELKRRAFAAWEYARANHTLEEFGEAYRSFLREILGETSHIKSDLGEQPVTV